VKCRVILAETVRDTDDIDELYEREVEADVDDIREVLHWTDEWVVAVEQMVDQTHFIVTAKTFQQHKQYTHQQCDMIYDNIMIRASLTQCLKCKFGGPMQSCYNMYLESRTCGKT